MHVQDRGLLPSRARIHPGETVGVVLLTPGGPKDAREVRPYLYRLLMDPERTRYRFLKGKARNLVATVLSKWLSRHQISTLALVGGASPEVRLTREQGHMLERSLNRMGRSEADARFKVYVASRYGNPTVDSVVRIMQADQLDRVVLLPLTPIPLERLTGSLVTCWLHAAKRAHALWPISLVEGYAEQDEFSHALADRIHEALQRFDAPLRSDAHLVFAFNPASAPSRLEDQSPERSPLYPLVERVMAGRPESRPFSCAYVRSWGLWDQPSPTVSDVLQDLYRKGVRRVVVVPMGYTCDTMETAYDLDVSSREEAVSLGIHLEVSTGLNCNALFMKTLSQAVAEHAGWLQSGDGMVSVAPPEVIQALNA